jgi:hypothetical protein
MGRPPLFSKALTNAEHQARWRTKQKSKAKAAKFAASRERRAASRSAPLIEPEFRVGDFRKVLADIPAASAALILTDPPYAKSAAPLLPDLADFAARVLMPGGSLLCAIGGTSYEAAFLAFRERLTFRWPLTLLHTQERPMKGMFVRIGGRPVLWFTSGPRRNRLMVPTVIRPIDFGGKSRSSDKSLHPWQQGNAIWQWVEPLTDPGELIVDPFVGSGEWGYICGAMGRRWIGADIVEGGSTEIAV